MCATEHTEWEGQGVLKAWYKTPVHIHILCVEIVLGEITMVRCRSTYVASGPVSTCRQPTLIQYWYGDLIP